MMSDDFVISETRKLQTLYELKKEIRYDHQRLTENHTESVAEHVYALFCLINYFLPLENPEGSWDKLKIMEMALIHDIDEIETGDIVVYKKTEEDCKNEIFAAKKVVSRLPQSIQLSTSKNLDEYDKQETIESKFVKAIDKFEPIIHCFSEEGKKTLLDNKFTLEMRKNSVRDTASSFPFINRFEEVLNKKFVEDGYYCSEES